jgi:hypothetical protein
MAGQSVNNYLKKTWKEAAMAYIQLSYQNLPTGREKTHENPL